MRSCKTKKGRKRRERSRKRGTQSPINMDTSLKRKHKGNTESIDKKECEWPNSGQLGKVDKPETNPYQVKKTEER